MEDTRSLNTTVRRVRRARRALEPLDLLVRVLLALVVTLLPILLAALAQSANAEGDVPSGRLVTLRAIVLADDPAEKNPRGSRILPSSPAALVDARDGKLYVEINTGDRVARGWAPADAFFVLDDPGVTFEDLLERARFQAQQGDRPVLVIGLLTEAIRRDPARPDVWRDLARAAEALAARSKPVEGDRAPAPVVLAGAWGVKLTLSGGVYRYDGEAYRRIVALAPEGPLAEEARVALLSSGPKMDLDAPTDLVAAQKRVDDIGEYLSTFPASPRRVTLLLQRARLVSSLADAALAAGDMSRALALRDAAIESASEVSATAPDAGRRRAADRLVTRLTKSFPRDLLAQRPVNGPSGLVAQFMPEGNATFLVVWRAGKDAIKPYAVSNPDPSSLAFDPSGRRLVWDEAPRRGERRTRVLDLVAAKVLSPAAATEPEILGIGVLADRYTTSLGFSPAGDVLLVVSEGFTEDGTRVPRRHYLCDVEGRRPPVLVERPFAGAGVVDWVRLAEIASGQRG